MGVGVNLDPPSTVAGAAGLGDGVDAMILLTTFMGRFVAGYTPAAPGFAGDVVRRWRNVSATLGREVEAKFADGTTIRGVAADVDQLGGLVLENAGGTTIVHSGEVVHLR